VFSPTVNMTNFAGLDATIADAQQGLTGDRFAAMLEDVNSGEGDAQREAAEQLVGIALFLPLLKQARENPFKTELFHGGPGEERFAGQFDQQIADRLAQRWAGPIVESMLSKVNTHG
jgi:hypothetical protein